MKTIRLQFKHNPTGKPRTFQVDTRDGLKMYVSRIEKYSDGSKREDRMVLTISDSNGETIYTNENGCAFVKVAIDLRPKPFSISGREEGRGPAFVEKFATLEDLKKYVLGHWQGWEYADGETEFHSDYVAFEIKGATLHELELD